MLLILPWMFMFAAIAGVILLWGDYLKETQDTIEQEEKERMMEHESCSSESGYHEIRCRSDCKCG